MSVPVAAPTRPAPTAGVAVAPRRTRRPRDLVATILLYAVLVAGLLVMVGPFLWMLMSSFKTEGEVRLVPPTWWPQHPTLANYHELFARLDFPKYFRNSAIVAGLVTLGNLVFCSAVGYALAKLPFPGRRALFGLVLGTVMVPGMVTFVPLFVLVSNLHLVNTYAGLVLPFLAGAFGVFFMRQFILSIPDDLLESARVTGAGHPRHPHVPRVVEQLPVAAGGGDDRGQVHAAGRPGPVQRRAEPDALRAVARRLGCGGASGTDRLRRPAAPLRPRYRHHRPEVR